MDHQIEWDFLEAEGGDHLYRHETPEGWIIYNEETGDLEYIPDEEKDWLRD